METLIVLLAALFCGMWLLNDANRLNKHVTVAEKLMAQGSTEEESMERSGCNFWDTPWYKRVLKQYPEIPTV